MIEPLHHFSDTFDRKPLGQSRPLDHDDGQAQLTRGIDLGARALPAGIARHDPSDAPRKQHLAFACERERPARDDEIGIRQRQRTSRSINETEREGMLRPGRKRRDMLPANREEHPGSFGWQRRDGGGNVSNLDPVIAGGLFPWLAFQRDQRRIQLRAGCQRITADLRCKGMGRIDHMRELFLPDNIGKSVRTAEASDTHGQRLIGRNLRSTGIGIDRLKPRRRDLRRQPIGVARSAQDENAHG